MPLRGPRVPGVGEVFITVLDGAVPSTSGSTAENRGAPGGSPERFVFFWLRRASGGRHISGVDAALCLIDQRARFGARQVVL